LRRSITSILIRLYACGAKEIMRRILIKGERKILQNSRQCFD
jgi:hypothetical protein